MGRLVGAITHVLVNDPARGYGTFAQWMAEEAYIASGQRRRCKLQSRPKHFAIVVRIGIYSKKGFLSKTENIYTIVGRDCKKMKPWNTHQKVGRGVYMMQRIRVLVVDDNREFADLLQEYLQKQDDMEVVGVAYSSSRHWN